MAAAIVVGARVRVGGKEGVVHFVGETHFAPGAWVGIELDTAAGKNNGTVKGVTYFACAERRGLFVKKAVVQLVGTAFGSRYHLPAAHAKAVERANKEAAAKESHAKYVASAQPPLLPVRRPTDQEASADVAPCRMNAREVSLECPCRVGGAPWFCGHCVPPPVMLWAAGSVPQKKPSMQPQCIAAGGGAAAKPTAIAAAIGAATTALPSGWGERRSRSTGELYFHHGATGYGQWERPSSCAATVRMAPQLCDQLRLLLARCAEHMQGHYADFNCTRWRAASSSTWCTDLGGACGGTVAIGDDMAAVVADELRHNVVVALLYITGGEGAAAAPPGWDCVHGNNRIRRRRVEDRGAGFLAWALRGNSTLTDLRLVNNRIGDAGTAQLAGALRENATLTQLDLAGNLMGVAGAIQLADALLVNKALQALGLDHNATGDAGATQLAGALRGNATLTELSLGTTGVSDAGTAQLAGALRVSATLKRLCLSREYRVTRRAGVLLADNGIGNAGAMQLADAIRNNARTSLTWIDLRGNRVSATEMQTVLALVKFHPNSTVRFRRAIECRIGRRQGIEKGAVIAVMGREECVEFSTTNCITIGDAGAVKVADALRDNSTVLRMLLAGNSIGAEGAAMLADALHSNAALKMLHLDCNQVGDAGAARFSDALRVNSTLTALHLAHNKIGDSGVAQLANALRTNVTLEGIFLSVNLIGDEGAAQLACALRANASVRTLNLASNRVGDGGAGRLAAALATNSTLTKLHLDRNKIGDTGAVHLANALCSDNRLALTLPSYSGQQCGARYEFASCNGAMRTLGLTLGLRQNLVGDDGATQLARALRCPGVLRAIDLGSNEIGDAGGAQLASALLVNTTCMRARLPRTCAKNYQDAHATAKQNSRDPAAAQARAAAAHAAERLLQRRTLLLCLARHEGAPPIPVEHASAGQCTVLLRMAVLPKDIWKGTQGTRGSILHYL
jgi:Ran GTPase-activating protein (RanGAP) involved in mRNA processing and transport